MKRDMHRREFLECLLAAGAVIQSRGAMAADETSPTSQSTADQPTTPTQAGDTGPKIRLGIIGCGQRGRWIANLFKEHGGYEITAVADYFADRALETGQAAGVPSERCFSGLSGYQKLIDTRPDAVLVISLPYFYPQHAAAAVDAGIHVYMAKPVAVDVPGTLRIGQLGEQAKKAGLVFHIDYQIPTDPANSEVVRRVHNGALGQLKAAWSCGFRDDNGFEDPPLTGNIEDRFTAPRWVNDDVLGGGYLVNYDVHIIDALVWALKRRPIQALGKGDRCRPTPHGDSLDTYSVSFVFEDGLAWHHQAAVGTGHEWICQQTLDGSIQGQDAAARLSYYKKAYVRGGAQHLGATQVEDLYPAGARRNIAEFHKRVTEKRYENETVARSVDSTLTAILGREAVRRGILLTMARLLEENKALELDLRGLKQ